MTIDIIREKYREKLSTNNLDANDKEMLKLMGNLLKDDMCFIKININLALNILSFIGYEKKEVKEIYVKLINEAKQKLDGKYRLVNLNNK